MSLEEVKKSLGILAVVAGIATAVACGGGSSYSSNPTSPNPAPSATPVAAADVTITIQGMLGAQSYSPNPGAVKAGQTVSWHNADSISHTATGSGFDTGAVAPGSTSAPIKFSTAGSFDYHCSFHPSMVGTLTVQ